MKKVLLFSLLFISQTSFAVNVLDLYKASPDSLNQFSIGSQPKGMMSDRSLSVSDNNSLQQINQTKEDNQLVVRYQQYYKGIPVVGAQVMIAKDSQSSGSASQGEVNGQLLGDINLDINPSIKSQQALEIAKTDYNKTHTVGAIQNERAELQIRPELNNELKLVYMVSFRSVDANNKPVWPIFIIDAQSGEITNQWNNIKEIMASGPGGNEKVKQYWYGKDGLPGLEVSQKGNVCIMESQKVQLVNLSSAWDYAGLMLTPFQYPCNNHIDDQVNGAYSPRNDAYYFGHTIVDMYQDWYGVNALQNANGTPMKLVMRVHFGQNFDNAFWDGKTMSFGDGSDFYPLVSLDVAGHEVTHGYTEQHSNLEYHDQSGALNESLSDMAGQASRAYLLEKNPILYGKAYMQSQEVTWGIGETITREAFGKALRFMDYPSSDGSSADCLDKAIAQGYGAYCAISYSELLATANEKISDPNERQNYIVHTASGVYNKAFYLLAKQVGIKKAYQVMLNANTKYWRPTTDFTTGACGVLHSAKELNVDLNVVKSVFGQVGINTNTCPI